MATETGNIAAAPVTLHPDNSDKYASANLMLYRTSIALLHTLVDEDIFTEGEYRKARAMLNKKYGLSSSSIFADTA